MSPCPFVLQAFIVHYNHDQPKVKLIGKPKRPLCSTKSPMTFIKYLHNEILSNPMMTGMSGNAVRTAGASSIDPSILLFCMGFDMFGTRLSGCTQLDTRVVLHKPLRKGSPNMAPQQ
jgi:hypothetical protein